MLTQNIMKIYFDGCSNTWGAELQDNLKSRYSRLVCDHFNAEEYNIALKGGSTKRVVRNLLKHDLSDYDMFVIQFTHKVRGEWYDEENKKWRKIQRNKQDIKYKKLWVNYHKYIYTNELGDLDAMINYTLVRTLLKDKPHVIIGLDFPWDYSFSTDSKDSIPVPLDIRYSYGEPKKFMGRYLNTENPKKIPRKPYSHPNEDGHRYIADDIIRWFS